MGPSIYYVWAKIIFSYPSPLHLINFLVPCHCVQSSKFFYLLYRILTKVSFRGIHPLLKQWCIFPLFQIPPYFQKNFKTVENFINFIFSRKISRFSPAIISDDLFLSHRPQILDSPIFPVSVHFLLFRKNYYFPLLWKISPCFRKIHLLFTYFMCISFLPYFDHDAFMHHPMHVLDAPAAMKQIRAFSVVGLLTWNGLHSEHRIINRTLHPVAYLGGGHGAMSTPFRATIIFSACNNLCGENNGLVACESSSKES